MSCCPGRDVLEEWFWCSERSCRSELALPRIIGEYGPRATQSWHCQGFLANTAMMPPNPGTARDYRRGPPRLESASMRSRTPAPKSGAPIFAIGAVTGVYFAADISPGPLASAGTRKGKVDEELAMYYTPARPSRSAGGHARVQHRAHIFHPILASRIPSNAKLSSHGLLLNERRHLCNLFSLTSTIPTRLLLSLF